MIPLGRGARNRRGFGHRSSTAGGGTVNRPGVDCSVWASRGVVATTLLAFVAGYALWPPGSVYWTSVADAIGAPATVGVVLVLAGAAGAVVARVTGATVGRIALGGAIAYAIGMALVESLLTPDSPVHFFLYAALLVCWLVGAVAVTLTPRRGAVTRP